MHRVYLGLGSNLGNREALLQEAITKIKRQIGNIVSQSAFYSTEPWGFASEHQFLNAAVCCDTTLEPLQILDLTQDIERDLGRNQKSVERRYEDRTIDIDLLLFDDVVLNSPRLTLPHPLMHQRRFVLEPLSEIAPQLQHPVLRTTIAELLDQQ